MIRLVRMTFDRKVFFSFNFLEKKIFILDFFIRFGSIFLFKYWLSVFNFKENRTAYLGQPRAHGIFVLRIGPLWKFRDISSSGNIDAHKLLILNCQIGYDFRTKFNCSLFSLWIWIVSEMLSLYIIWIRSSIEKITVCSFRQCMNKISKYWNESFKSHI